MGGKTKQRTKNNARPSSSGRSAELLNNAKKVESSVGAAGQSKDLPVLFSTLSVTNVDAGLNPEFSVCFKKLNKKDPITKTKALQELTELVKNRDIDEVVASLPSWAHSYQTLIIDSDRRVREAAQLCHGAMVAASGRRAALVLRRVLPVWLLARHDEHAPVSVQANAQLKITFPERKLGEAISFCKSEIVTLLIENITGNAEVMLNKKLDNPEEREMQILRILCSSLRALDFFVTELPEVHDDWLWDALAPLLQSNAFWKLAAHQSPNIRAAWYGAHAEPLLRALFQLTLDHPLGDARVSSSAWLSARAAWSAALGALPPGERARLRAHARLAVHAHVFSDMDKLDMKRIGHAAALCPYLYLPSQDSPSEHSGEVVSLTKELFEMQTLKPEVPLEVFALRCDCIDGNINCPFEDENEFIKKIVNDSESDHEELTRRDLIVFLYESLFRVSFLRAILTQNVSSDEEDEETESWCDVLLREEYFKAKLNRVLYEYAILSVLYEKYSFWPHYELIKKSKERMEKFIEDIISEISPETKNVVLTYLHANAITKGYYWSYAKKYFIVIMNKIAQKIRERNDDTSESQSSVDDSDEESEKEEEQATSNNQDTESSEYQSIIENLDKTTVEEMITGSGFFHSMQADAAPSERARALLMLRSVWRAHGHEAGLRERADSALRDEPADLVIDLYFEHHHIMLYDTDLTDASWCQIVSNAAIVHFLTECVRARGWELGSHQWDFTNITLCSLITSLQISMHRWWCCKVAIIARAVLELYLVVEQFTTETLKEAERRQPSEHVLALPVEWGDIFEPDLNRNLFELLIVMLKADIRPMTASRVSTLGAMASCCSRLQWACVPRAPRASALSLRLVCGAATGALRGVAHPVRKYLAFAVLDLLAESLVLHDAEKLAEWCARDDDSPRPEFTLTYYDEALVHLQDLVDAALSNINVCEGTCEMVAPSDSHSVALGHQLLALVLLRHCARARGDLAQFYIELLREGGYAAGLMSSCVRLLPADVLRVALEGTERAPMPARWLHCFSELPSFDVNKRCDGEVVAALACLVLTETLGGAAAGEARGWCGALGVRAAGALRRVVRAAVAPVLRHRLLLQLRDRAHELPDSQVTIQWSRAEVRCELELEERTLELTVQFAEEHPLVPPQITAPPNSPAPDTQWIVLYLAYQNGTLLNALKMWISAVTARVQSSPQCYICYCRMHPSSGRLPTVPCYQCRNKFHSPCLRKWFSTSNKSNCPLCRTKF